MARAQRKPESSIEPQAEGHVDETAVANDAGDVFGQAIADAQARQEVPVALPVGPTPPHLLDHDRAAERQQEAQARDAERAAHHEGNGRHGNGHNDRPAAEA